MPINLVLFDMDDVLCRYDVDGRIANLAAIAGCTPAHVRERIWESGFIEAADRGAYDADAYLAAFGERIGCALTRQQWLAARRDAMTPFRDVLTLVEQVRAVAAVGVLTNNDLIVASAIAELFPALPALFGDRFLVSASLGVAKPDPACFHAACRVLCAEPAETFFTDDRAENVAGARAAGLTGHVFSGAPGLERALRGAGLALA
jgi:HAD superfamily hydrolase (TIGR01509 family)